MDNKLREIELETANLKLERERLALRREMDSHRRIEKAAHIGVGVVETTRAVGSGAWTLVKFLLSLALGSILGLCALLVFVAFHAASSDKVPGDFQYRFGYLMGGVPDWVYPIVMLVGMILVVIQLYEKK